MMTGTIKNSSPPLVIESIEAEGTVWMLSFNGSNPDENDAIELTKEQCFWLFDKIMNIDHNPKNHNKISFLEELTALSHKHGLYISNTLNHDGSTKEDIYMIELESHMNAAGYVLQENGSLVFSWY